MLPLRRLHNLTFLELCEVSRFNRFFITYSSTAYHNLRVEKSDKYSRNYATRTRTRTLRPLLIPPAFSPDILSVTPPITTTTSTEEPPPPPAETDFSPTTIAIAHLPPNTLKSDIRPVFQQFGEVIRIWVHTDGSGAGAGTRADVMFADVHGVKRTLHAYAERPIRVRGKEVIVFRKRRRTREGKEEEGGLKTNDASVSRRRAGAAVAAERGGHDRETVFVSGFPQDSTQEELCEALAPFGKHEAFVMRPGSKYAFFTYSNDSRVEHILSVHRRVPITVRGRNLRLERAVNRPYSLRQGHAPELEKPFDPTTSSAIVEELKRTIPGWKGLYEPSRVLWIGRLPTNISHIALTNFWSRLGCVVEVRPSQSGFAYVEFASTEGALRAARQGAPHGFRYADRLLNVDFAPWKFFIGPEYRVVHISGWPASRTRPALLQWAYDVPNIDTLAVLPPFCGEQRSDPRCAFLQLPSIDEARAALRKLDGRMGPGGETLQVTLSRLPALPLAQLWRSMDVEGKEGETKRQEEEEERVGLGFATGNGMRDVAGLDKGGRERPQIGTRGGRRWQTRRKEDDRQREVSAVVVEEKYSSWERRREELREDEDFEDALLSTVQDGSREVESR